jgi:ATP-dependent protease ClpP protease subunit|tara:strand:+ start:3546 stop:4394 length:849 start_codon:yes stop_codon:yes gene_type:complete
MIIQNGLKPISMPKGLEQSDRRIFNRSSGTQFKAAADEAVTVIDLYDEIGYWGVNAKEFKRMLNKAGDVKLRIHSPGGDVYDGIAIYNDLLDHSGRVDVEVSGLAASAASIIAMAGDTITMAPTAFLMIHNAWGLVVGDRHDHADMAEVLTSIDGALASVYDTRGNLGLAEFVAMMDKETWVPADAAVDAGLADEVIEIPAPSAKYDLSGFKNAPADWHQPPEPTKRDFERLLMRDAKLTRSETQAFMLGGYQAMRDAGQDPEAMRDADRGFQLLSEIARKL